MPMVERIARDLSSMFARHVELEDLMQAGHLGLVRAAEAYDPAKASSVGFESFAYFKIRGSIIDANKRRAYREEANVSLQAIAASDGWLPARLDTDSAPLADAQLADEEIRRTLAHALTSLSDDEQRVLRAHLEGLSLTGTARLLNKGPTWTRTKLGEARAKVEAQFWEEGAI